MAGKFKIVVSDLHIGPGDFAAPNPLDDFNADAEFAHLLADIAAESKQTQKEVELIINGDWFEFLQVPAVDTFDPLATYPPAAYHNSSPEATLKRLEIIIANHPQIFTALADFIYADSPVRRVTVLNGNHDANLYWPQVQTRLREAMGAKGRRASCLTFATESINREQIYVEHGNQRTEKVNRFPDFQNPIDPNRPGQLYYPPGSEFVINYFNLAEREAWWIDNVKPFTSLIWFALKWDFELAAQLLLGFLMHSPGLILGSFAVGETDEANSFMASLENEVQRQEMARQYAANAEFRQAFHRQVYQLLRPAGVTDGAQAFDVARISDDPLLLAQAEQEAVRTVLYQTAADLIERGHANVVLFGHTHKVAFEKIGEQGYYINTGAWLWNEDMNDATQKMWLDLFNHPEHFTASRRLPYARINYDETNQPRPQLLDYSGQGFPASPRRQSFWERLLEWIFRLFGAG